MTDKELLAKVEQCSLYNFDSVEMVECKHALWNAMLDELRAPAQGTPIPHAAQLASISRAIYRIREWAKMEGPYSEFIKEAAIIERRIEQIGLASPAATSTPAPAPMAADIAQIIDAGRRNGKADLEIAEEVLREFDAAPAQRAPVAWRWRHVNSPSKDWNYQQQPISNHNEYLEVEPLYALTSTERSSPLKEATLAQHFNLPKGERARFVLNGVLETCQCRNCSALPSTVRGDT